jgi:hypothetical protein
LLSAGMDGLELDRMAASVTMPDGSPRFVWTDVRPDHDTYVKTILDSISEHLVGGTGVKGERSESRRNPQGRAQRGP